MHYLILWLLSDYRFAAENQHINLLLSPEVFDTPALRGSLLVFNTCARVLPFNNPEKTEGKQFVKKLNVEMRPAMKALLRADPLLQI
ncbi:MAG: hypothetical protein EOO05_11455 [Chitinophagaceae bacterium]|nr:MAG: hypothetical protein EOO05_11455 [Chitinophagaceae bacterium]